MAQQQQQPIEWGVMYHDGSVAHRWNGRTQRERAEEEVAAYFKRYTGSTDNVTLAHRPGGVGPWRRV